MPATSEITHETEDYDTIESSVTNVHGGKTDVCMVTLFTFSKSEIFHILPK